MIKIIIGTKGTGKTKKLIDMVNVAAENEKGHVVCIEYGDGLRYNIPASKARLINAKEYNISGFESLAGFVKGLFAGNYDISSVFVDGALKITGNDLDKLGETLADIDKVIGEASLIVLVSADAADAPETLKKYVI